MSAQTFAAIMAGLVVILALGFATLVGWLASQARKRDEALLRDIIGRTMPAPITNARGAPPPESPEERAGRVARGEYSTEEIRAAAKRLATKIGPLTGSPEEIEQEVGRLLRSSNGEIP